MFQSVPSLLQVEAFCDVDAKKIGRGHYVFEDSTVCGSAQTTLAYLVAMQLGECQLPSVCCLCLQEVPKPRVPIVHFSEANGPFVLCVKWVS